jgi:hypothetical protein
MKVGFLDLLDPSNDPEFFWQVISGPPCIDKLIYNFKIFIFLLINLNHILGNPTEIS